MKKRPRCVVSELVSSPNRELQAKLKSDREANLSLPKVKRNINITYVSKPRGYDADKTTGKGTLC
jgi:hypothetical protein